MNKEKPAKPKHDIYFWKVYCYAITFWAPAPLLKLFGLPTKIVNSLGEKNRVDFLYSLRWGICCLFDFWFH